MNEQHISIISSELKVKPTQVAATIELLDGGNTLPFIARYRKEATGGLDEEQIRLLTERLDTLRKMDERRAAIIASVEEQGKLTPELQKQFESAQTITALEDLYAPYKPKRRTRAMIARERGLEPLAQLILGQARSGAKPEQAAAAFLNEDVPNIEEALAGARDIVAEMVSDHAEVRRLTREKALKFATLSTEKVEGAADEKAVYKLYYEFSMRVDKLRPHQVLAINRGEKEKVLKVSLDIPERDWRDAVARAFRVDQISAWGEQLQAAIDDAAKRLLLPSIENDVRNTFGEQSERHAIQVFGVNLRGLLTQAPLSGHVVMGIDPGFRTGCKVAVVDGSGKILDTATIYPHQPQNHAADSLKTLKALIEKHGVTLISIGNGTASRETEQLVATLLRNLQSNKSKTHYLITNEAGASVYSASPLARTEMPDLDVSMRGAVSIARRVQDPLAELVKIDPKSIGVGMYQHDVDQKQLAATLDGVVESVVNRVGVDVNTASPALLTYVAGIGPKLAEKIVAHRNDAGPFASRSKLKDVSGLGPKAFEQCAGFLRVRGGGEALDASAIHPESYSVAKKLMKRAGISLEMPIESREQKLKAIQQTTSLKALASELGCGEPTLTDIFEQLVRPGRDPREDVPPPILRSDVLSMDDLKAGLRLDGTVRNVVDFGAFIDIGVKQDGLLHRSQIPYGTVLNVGDIIPVEIASVEKERGRIGLAWPGKVEVDWRMA
ncbi:MAG: Tex family protein [Caldilineaceae bacterium]